MKKHWINAKHLKKVNYTSLAIAAMFFASSCSEKADELIMDEPTIEEVVENTEVPVEYAPLQLSRAEQAMMESMNSFGIEFLKAAAAEKLEGNLMYAVPGITGTISMAANLVAGDAQREIREIFGIDEDQLESLNTLNSRVAAQLSYVDEDVNTSVANSVWIDTKFNPDMSFIAAMKESYKADIFTEILSDNATMQKINAWASEKTKGMIENFLDTPIDDTYNLFLVNALYFNGGWTDTFDKSFTKEDVFTCYDGTKADIMMMHNGSLALPYMANEDAKWLKLYFGKETFAITFIMPENDINEYIKGLTKEDIDKFNSLEKKLGVIVNIPRMNLGSYSDNIIEILRKMGISKIFDGNADFTPLAGYAVNGLGSNIIQKTRFEIDEEGAKAAGLTGNFVVGAQPGVVPEHPTFTLNRPFVFILTEEASNTILFAGRVMSL